jgi:hypothetical protein
MHHEGILIFIFLALVLLFPIIIFIRVYGVTYSGLRASGHSKKPVAQPDDTAKSQQIPEKQAEQKQSAQ